VQYSIARQKQGGLMDIRKMSVEEKIARLSEIDKAYILGYIDRALQEKSKGEKGKINKKVPKAVENNAK